MTTATAPSTALPEAVTVRSVFNRLKDSGVKYTVTRGFLNAPAVEPDEMHLMTDQLERLVRVGDFKKDREQDNQRGPWHRIHGCRTRFYLMEKGKGFFPEPFESQLLAHSDDPERNGVRRPQNHLLMTASLYVGLYRQNWWSENKEMRQVVDAFLSNQTGPAVPPPD